MADCNSLIPKNSINKILNESRILYDKYKNTMFPRAKLGDQGDYYPDTQDVLSDLESIEKNLFQVIDDLILENYIADTIANANNNNVEKVRIEWNRQQRDTVWEILQNYFTVTQRVQFVVEIKLVNLTILIFQLFGRVTVLNQNGQLKQNSQGDGNTFTVPKATIKKCGKKMCVISEDNKNRYCMSCICGSSDEDVKLCPEHDEVCPDDPIGACGDCRPCPGGNTISVIEIDSEL